MFWSFSCCWSHVQSLSDTTGGANISFNCEPGLEPQREDVSVCFSNGSWVPNPAHRICSTLPSSKGIIILFMVYPHCIITPAPIAIDCGQPVLTPNVRVVSTTGTSEGNTVTLQCEDGLYPIIPVLITCNSSGVWSPNPTEFVCNIMPGIIDLYIMFPVHQYYIYQQAAGV